MSDIYRCVWSVRFRACFRSKALIVTSFFATVFCKRIYESTAKFYLQKNDVLTLLLDGGWGLATKAGKLRVGAIFLCLLNLYGKQKRMSRCSFAVLAIFGVI